MLFQTQNTLDSGQVLKEIANILIVSILINIICALYLGLERNIKLIILIVDIVKVKKKHIS